MRSTASTRRPKLPDHVQSNKIHYPETDGKPLAESDFDEIPALISQVLGLRITLSEANQIQFYDVTTAKRLLSDAEARQTAEAFAQNALQHATQEATRAEQAEAEIAHLRAELAKLRGEQ